MQEQWFEWMRQHPPALGSAIAAVPFLYGLVKGYLDGRKYLTDILARLRDVDYAVQATIFKVIVRPNSTETVKLRTIRVYRRLRHLEIDPVPTLFDEEHRPIRPCQFREFYSVPGRASVTPNGMLAIDFMDDEALEAHRDHSIVLGYEINESIDVIFKPPGIRARSPVGSELLIMEVHFPAGYPLKRHDGKPDIELVSIDRDGNDESRIPVPLNKWWGRPRRVDVTGGRYDFGGSEGETDWLRVSVTKPPTDRHIRLRWQRN
jgi:hypothetical protein